MLGYLWLTVRDRRHSQTTVVSGLSVCEAWCSVVRHHSPVQFCVTTEHCLASDSSSLMGAEIWAVSVPTSRSLRGLHCFSSTQASTSTIAHRHGCMTDCVLLHMNILSASDTFIVPTGICTIQCPQ